MENYINKEMPKNIDDIISSVIANEPSGSDLFKVNIKKDENLKIPFSGKAILKNDFKIIKVDLLEFYMSLNYEGGVIQNKIDVSKLKFKIEKETVSWNLDSDWKTKFDLKDKVNLKAEFIAKIPLIIQMENLKDEYLLNLIFSSKATPEKCKSVKKMPIININLV